MIAETRVQELFRQGKVKPPPTIIAGRRLWTEDQVRQAAEHLGILTAELGAEIAAAFAVTSDEVLR